MVVLRPVSPIKRAAGLIYTWLIASSPRLSRVTVGHSIRLKKISIGVDSEEEPYAYRCCFFFLLSAKDKNRKVVIS